MRTGFRVLVLLSGLSVVPALADPVVIEAPGEKWQLKFEGPAVTAADPSLTNNERVYTGNGGRFNVSLHVWEPDCPGGDSQENIYKCFGARLENAHGFDERVELESVKKVTKTLALFIAGWCGVEET